MSVCIESDRVHLDFFICTDTKRGPDFEKMCHETEGPTHALPVSY